MIEQFKKNKKAMMDELNRCRAAEDSAVNTFIDFVKSLVKDASGEDVKNFLNSNDEAIEFEDKIAIAAAFAENHNDIGGIAIVSVKKSDESKSEMPKAKVSIRTRMEDYFNETDETLQDDWLSIPYENENELSKIIRVFEFVKQRNAKAANATIDVDNENKIVWIIRQSALL